MHPSLGKRYRFIWRDAAGTSHGVTGTVIELDQATVTVRSAGWDHVILREQILDEREVN